MTDQRPGQWTVDGIRIRETTSPALNVLQRDRLELIESGDRSREPELHALREEFADRRVLVNWYQAAIVRTLGYLDLYAPPELLVYSPILTDGLLKGDEAPADALQVEEYLDHMYQPAYEAAYDDVQANSQEWTGSGEDSGDYLDVNTTTEKNIAFKPAFRLLDEEQADALRSFWKGFGSDRSELRNWAGSLTAVARPLYTARTWQPRLRLPERPIQELVMDDPVAVDHLLVDTTGDLAELSNEQRDALEYKYGFAATVLLPGMALKARSLQYSAEEAAGGPRSRSSDTTGNISTMGQTNE